LPGPHGDEVAVLQSFRPMNRVEEPRFTGWQLRSRGTLCHGGSGQRARLKVSGVVCRGRTAIKSPCYRASARWIGLRNPVLRGGSSVAVALYAMAGLVSEHPGRFS